MIAIQIVCWVFVAYIAYLLLAMFFSLFRRSPPEVYRNETESESMERLGGEWNKELGIWVSKKN